MYDYVLNGPHGNKNNGKVGNFLCVYSVQGCASSKGHQLN